MSILLEALKKSEQQRQLGKTPTLQTNTEDSSPIAGDLNHWIGPLLVVLSLGLMTWFGWQQYRVPETVDVSVQPEVVSQSGDSSAPLESTESAQRTMIEKYKEMKKGQRASLGVPPVVASTDQNKDKSRLNKSFNDFTETNDEQQQVKTAGPETQSTGGSTSPGVFDKPEKPEAAASTASIQSPPAKLEPHISKPISYWELPQGVRDNLPEIKITVLVYASQSKDRFLLTNGQRLAEKDELGSGVVLDEIRRDGAIFVYRKYRFFVSG